MEIYCKSFCRFTLNLATECLIIVFVLKLINHKISMYITIRLMRKSILSSFKHHKTSYTCLEEDT